jgi:hypothetical protein
MPNHNHLRSRKRESIFSVTRLTGHPHKCWLFQP